MRWRVMKDSISVRRWKRTGGDKAEAARLLNLSQRTFYRKLAKYNF